MSDTSSLSQLAKFVGQSALASDDPAERQRVIGAMAAALQPRAKRSVSDLLGVVMVLSARTRRMVLPHVGVDVDVFSPDGLRAVRMTMPQRT
jgi:hypothetical protein